MSVGRITFGNERSMSELRRKTHLEPTLAAARIRELEGELAEAKEVLGMSLSVLGQHARGFAQEALVRACYLVGSKPEDWTRHPEVMEQRRALVDEDRKR